MNKIMLFAVCLAGSVLSANAQSISVPYNTIKVQKNVATDFNIVLAKGSNDISALQAGLSKVANVTINKATSLTGDTIKYSESSNLGTPIVVTYNFNNPTTQPSQTAFVKDTLVSVNVTASNEFTKSTMTITPTASAIGGAGVTVAPITVDVKQNGDANADGTLDTQDAVAVVDAWSSSAATYDYVSDFNNDGTVDTQDAVAIVDVWAASAKAGQVDLGD